MTEKNYFSVVPQPDCSEGILHAFSAQTIHRLTQLIDISSNELGVDSGAILQRLNKLQNGARLYHFIYCVAHEMDLAIQTEQWKPLKGLLGELGRLKELVAPKNLTEICSVEDSGYDKKLIRNWESAKPKAYDGPDFAPVHPAKGKDVAEAKALIPEIWKNVRALLPGYVTEIETYITSVRLYRGGFFFTNSDRRAFGAIYLQIPDKDKKTYYLEQIIHETSHLQLFALMSLDYLVLNPLDELYLSSPKRKDPRPMPSILHQNFVLWRLRDALKTALDGGIRYEGLDKRYEESVQLFEIGAKILSEHAKVTPSGQTLLQSMGISVEAPILQPATGTLG